jgi:Neprosin
MRKSQLLLSLLVASAMALAGGGLAQAATTRTTTTRVVVRHTAASPASKAPPDTFTAFRSFVADTQQATYAEYSARSESGGVENAQAFDQMRSYVDNLYRGVQTVSSFEYQGNTFDCVTEMSQPTVNALGLKHLATSPKISAAAEVSGAKSVAHGPADHAVTSPLQLGEKDAFGHDVSCAAGTIPMERVTLDTVTRFPTLHDFLSKGAATQAVDPGYGEPHRHAYGYQYVTNYGGNSWLNLWNPSGDFSLSQQWYVGGSGSGTQTVEGGWVHYPAAFGSNSVLFIFYTPNDYTSGCWNLECSGFVQTNNSWALGAGFNNYSSYDGGQYGFTEQWKYYDGNWWLFLQGSGSLTAVGYYPGSLYGSGPMSQKAALMEAGGEVCNGLSGGDNCTNPNWPQMGSGNWASAGWQKAAYQNTIFYIPQDVSGGSGVWTSLTGVTESAKCYSIAVTPASSGGSWGSYFYFGGPGGYEC